MAFWCGSLILSVWAHGLILSEWFTDIYPAEIAASVLTRAVAQRRKYPRQWRAVKPLPLRARVSEAIQRTRLTPGHLFMSVTKLRPTQK